MTGTQKVPSPNSKDAIFLQPQLHSDKIIEKEKSSSQGEKENGRNMKLKKIKKAEQEWGGGQVQRTLAWGQR